jgi:hypothetical protein
MLPRIRKYNRNKGNKEQNKRRNQLRLFTLKREFLKISPHSQTALGAETHRAEEQWLEEQLNVVKLRMFRLLPNADCYEERRATFSASKDIY